MVAKESALAKEGQEQQKLVREKEDLAGELDKAKDENRTAREKCKEIEKELGLVTDRHRATQAQLDKVK